MLIERQEAINQLLVQNLVIDQILTAAQQAVQVDDQRTLAQVFAAADQMGL